MSLSVIGAGFGRTGTFSLNLALELLGFGPCHHMDDVIQSEQQKSWFLAAGKGALVDWDEVYAGFNSAVDWPTCYFWRELAMRYPEARIILTTRDPAQWFESATRTIFQTMQNGANPESFGVTVVLNNVFGRNVTDARHAISVMETHNRAVIAAIPAERLLVYEVTDGWGPLCSFLRVPEPIEPFPRSNNVEEFQARFLQHE